MSEPYRIFIGWDPREATAVDVCRLSILRRTSVPVAIRTIDMADLASKGLYRRPHERRDGVLWDVVSDAPMATAHACARFFVPFITEPRGWALFMDGDILCLDDIRWLFARADPRKAVTVVQHDHRPVETGKMDGQIQTRYARKNWSSVMLWNLEHPANRALTLDMVNTLPGRDLHRFCWLDDSEIGAFPVHWNWLEGVTPTLGREPGLVHFTRGTPDMPGYENVDYAGEWRRELEIMRAANVRF